MLKMNWEELLEEYLLELVVRGYTERTIEGYTSTLTRVSKYFAEQGIDPLQVKKQHLKRWVVHCMDSGYGAYTINKMLTTVKGMYAYCISEEYLTVNPCIGVPNQRRDRKIIYPLNDSEIKQILHVAAQHPYPLLRHRNKVILMLMLDCGLRIGEVERLNEGDVLQNQLYIKKAKNRKERAVALSPATKKAIMQYVRQKHRLGLDNEALIVNYHNTRMTRNNIWTMMNKLKEKVNIREEVRFSGHTLRHTYAAMQIRNGLDIHTLSLNMGHEDISITQIYLRSLHSDDFIEQSIKTSTLMNLR